MFIYCSQKGYLIFCNYQHCQPCIPTHFHHHYSTLKNPSTKWLKLCVFNCIPSLCVEAYVHNAVNFHSINKLLIKGDCNEILKDLILQFLFEAVSAHCVELATDCHGCRVLQKCLGHSDGEHRRRLLSAIIANALILSQDPFGYSPSLSLSPLPIIIEFSNLTKMGRNYVVQYVFELEGSWARTEVLNQLEGYYRYLSMQKYSSNVVEKCLKYAGEEQFARIIQEFMDHPQLDQMMLDPYANYVIQTALNHSKVNPPFENINSTFHLQVSIAKSPLVTFPRGHFMLHYWRQ